MVRSDGPSNDMNDKKDSEGKSGRGRPFGLKETERKVLIVKLSGTGFGIVEQVS